MDQLAIPPSSDEAAESRRTGMRFAGDVIVGDGRNESWVTAVQPCQIKSKQWVEFMKKPKTCCSVLSFRAPLIDSDAATKTCPHFLVLLLVVLSVLTQ